MKKLTALFAFAILGSLDLFAQASQDSVFRLVQAEEAQQITEYGNDYRRVKGNAKFFHNNTTLLCDSASWNLDVNVIDCYGNVRILQEGTEITSETLTYLADEDLACFRGGLVQLKDKEGNILRTQHLDYNTKDSLATFEDGASLKSKEGNVIESLGGNYDSKIKVFVFQEDVKLYMDSIFLKTDRLDYLADSSKAFFGPNTNAWKDHGYVRSNAGWYDRKDTTVCFMDRVYGHDDHYEFWSDELYYYKRRALIEMIDHVSLLDTSRKVAMVGDYLRHEQDSSNTYLLNNPAVIYFGATRDDNTIDTLFMRADTLLFQGRYRCDFAEDELRAAAQRRADVDFDALSEYRSKAAAERQKKLEEEMRAAGKLPPLPQNGGGPSGPGGPGGPGGPPDGDEPSEPSEPAGASAAPSDTTAQLVVPAADSTPVNIIRAFPNFRMYREDMQAASDSLRFTDIDSIAILVGRPIMWNTEKNQLTSEVMHLLVKNGDVDKGSMLDDARITSKEAENCFNQIKSTEMQGFFHENELYRYDALGNVSAIIYMEENNELTNINVKESKSLTSLIRGGKARRMLYLDEIKSDAYPIQDLDEDRRRLKGFEWRIEERPSCRDSITTRPAPLSWRRLFPGSPKPDFIFTDHYFDNYMTDVYESIRLAEEAERQRRLAQECYDRTSEYADSLMVEEMTQLSDSLQVADSLLVCAWADSLKSVADSLKAAAAPKDTDDVKSAGKSDAKTVKASEQKIDKKAAARERRELRKKERERKRAERRAHREAKKKARAAS